VSVLVSASAMRTCLGDGAQTFAALCAGRSGVGDLRGLDGPRIGVLRGYQIADREGIHRTTRWLAECVAGALRQARVNALRQRVVVVVGTGLGELGEVERWDDGEIDLAVDRLHFGAAVRAAAPGVEQVLTLSNACSAGGHALALAQDLVELGEADVAVAAAADGLTVSMLAMIWRVGARPADQLRPFDDVRGGALLGEGAAALVLVPDGEDRAGVARVLATSMTCDAHHETAADSDGVARALAGAFERGGRGPEDVQLVLAHGTGTAINDPLECALLRDAYDQLDARPRITAIKGAVGHTSGAAALMSADVAIRCLHEQVVPPIVGLRTRIPESEGLALVADVAQRADLRLAQVNAFGFGGVNSVTLLEAA
jgi:3-oxoacyl-[acyl-carrier-protein] synthase II